MFWFVSFISCPFGIKTNIRMTLEKFKYIKKLVEGRYISLYYDRNKFFNRLIDTT